MRNSEPDFSFCILWSPLHPITALLPFIGHMGIADSTGRISDFQGSYYVKTSAAGSRNMAFGPVTRYLKIDGIEASHWDENISFANSVYCERIHNICCDNCHSHVAQSLNRMRLEKYGIKKWDMVKLCFLVFFKARFVSIGGFLCQFLPFVILVTILILFGS